MVPLSEVEDLVEAKSQEQELNQLDGHETKESKLTQKYSESQC